MQLIGYAVLATIKTLNSHNLFQPDSPIRDSSLVLGLLVSAAIQWPGGYDEPKISWAKAVISEASKHGIMLVDVPFGVEKDVKKFEEYDHDEDAPDWGNFAWKEEVCLLPPSLCTIFVARHKSRILMIGHVSSQFTAFSRAYAKVGSAQIGGNYYDLTKGKRRPGRPGKKAGR
jgi:hypothetical protein